MEHFIVELLVRGVVLCLLTAMALLLLRRAAAAYRHLICVLALGGLLSLPLAQRLLPPLHVLKPHSAPAPARLTIPTEESGRFAATHSKAALPSSQEMPSPRIIPSEATPLVPSGPVPIASIATPVPPAGRPSGNVPAVLTVTWGIGAFALLIRLMAALMRLRRLEASSRQEMLGSVPVLVSERVDTPLTWGIRRRLILMPATLLSADPAICESALRHEQAHIARLDWVWNLLSEIVCAFCWFQPGVWWLRRRMRLESERACDDRVLLSGIDGPDYAAHLLQILRSVRTSEVAPAMAHSGRMEERMQHILDTDRPRRAQTRWLAVSAPFALALLSLAALRVSARQAEAKPVADQDATVLKSGRSTMPSQPSRSPLPAAEFGAPNPAGVPFAQLPPISANGTVSAIPSGVPMAMAQPGEAPFQNNAPASEAPADRQAAPLEHVVWGDIVDGLQPGFLRTTPDNPDNRQVPLNSQVTYQVLVRNTTRKERAVEVQCKDFRDMDPSWIPDSDIRKALSGSKIPDDYRVSGVTDLAVAFLGVAVKLAPGEAVILPDVLHLYVGDGDKQNYPRIEQIKPGKNWIVQPIMARSLTPEEAAEDLASATSPYGNGIQLTVLGRDGIPTKKLGARRGIRQGSKKLYAKIQLQVATVAAANVPAEKPVQWGETLGGFQIGARIAQDGTVFHAGDVIKFQPFGRNLSGKDVNLTVGNYWKVNYKIQVQTLDGKPVYMERDAHNRAMLVAGYLGYPLGNGVTQEISEAKLKIIHPTAERLAGANPEAEDEWVEAIPLKPGRYRVRLLSWGVFGTRKPEPASGWIPIEVE
jgi:beta-lactamase regulating signal transducer with metallopeptidase domain